MRKINISFKIYYYILIFSVLTLTGCAKESNRLVNHPSSEIQMSEERNPMEAAAIEQTTQAENTADEIQEEAVEPITAEVDWSNYFEQINGAAVKAKRIQCFNLWKNRDVSSTKAREIAVEIVSDYLN